MVVARACCCPVNPGYHFEVDLLCFARHLGLVDASLEWHSLHKNSLISIG